MLCVLGLLAAGELTVRLGGERLGSGLRDLGAVPRRAERLAAADGPRVLVLGNSLTVRGVLPDTLADHLRGRRPGADCEVVAFLGAELCEWTRVLQHRFLAAGPPPDLVVVASGPRLWDVESVRGKRLALTVPATAALPIAREEFGGLEARAGWLHAALCRSFAAGPVVRRALLGRLLPHYDRGNGWLQEAIQARRARAAAADPPRRTYRRLRRLGRLGRERGTTVVLALMPFAHRYEVPPEALAAARESGVRLLDLRRLPGLRPEHFSDGVHLTPAGAAVFTPLLAEALERELPAGPAGATAATAAAGTAPRPGPVDRGATARLRRGS